MKQGHTTKRQSNPRLSAEGQEALDAYARYLREEQDLAVPTLRNYLSDLRHFAAWCELSWAEGGDEPEPFRPPAVSTPTITRYRSYLQTVAELKPATVNRHLVSIKRYFAWAADAGLVGRDPARVVKLVPRAPQPPRQLTDREENALVTAVTERGSVRDRTLLVLALHTGLRADELCGLKPQHVRLSKRSGHLRVYGKRNKYREVPLNSTAREALQEYLAGLPRQNPWLFPSQKMPKGSPEDAKTLAPITPRALGYIVQKYATLAKVEDLSPHDLRHRFGYRMAAGVPLHRLAQIMGHDSLDTTMIYVRSTKGDLQQAVEEIAWA
jgi:integrase/recombinase XerC